MKETSTPEEQVIFIVNARGNKPYSNTYNRGCLNHTNFAWSSPTNPRPLVSKVRQETINLIRLHPTKASVPKLELPTTIPSTRRSRVPTTTTTTDKFAKLEDLLTIFMSTSSQKFEKIEQFMDVTTLKFTSVEAGLRSHQASLWNLEVQIDNLVRILTERPRGALPSQTVANTKDQNVGLNAIQLRSGKVTPEAMRRKTLHPRVEKEKPQEKREEWRGRHRQRDLQWLSTRHPYLFPRGCTTKN
ncbi:unnamed protein product [Linum trigynum]|uniref:Uncharacterized protein n=1 Tax=Linum trigynum TaxID=586398 RepID=A0AAV2D713_9ROSI